MSPMHIRYKQNNQLIKTLLQRGQKLSKAQLWQTVLSLNLEDLGILIGYILTSIHGLVCMCTPCQALCLVQSLFGPQSFQPCLAADLHLNSTSVAATLHPLFFSFPDCCSFIFLPSVDCLSCNILSVLLLCGFSILIVFHSLCLSLLEFMLITGLDVSTPIASHWSVSYFLQLCSALFCLLAILCHPPTVSVDYCSF